MAVFCAAVFIFLFYTAAIPLKFALFVHISGQTHFGAGLSPFEGRFALRRARQRALGEKKHWPWKKAEADFDHFSALHALLRASGYLLRHTRLEKLFLQGKIASGDAAQTARLWGCAKALGEIAASVLCENTMQIQLNACFFEDKSDLQLGGILSMRLGHIICAALIGAWNYIIRSHSHGKASD